MVKIPIITMKDVIRGTFANSARKKSGQTCVRGSRNVNNESPQTGRLKINRDIEINIEKELRVEYIELELISPLEYMKRYIPIDPTIINVIIG